MLGGVYGGGLVSAEVVPAAGAGLRRSGAGAGPGWMDRAWCSTPEAAGLSWLAEDAWEADRARAACQTRCPVAATCLAYALDVEAGAGVAGRGGVWGGCMPEEREQAWRERRRAQRAAAGDGSER